MRVFQTNLFHKLFKKLHKNQKKLLDKAVQNIIINPSIGKLKTGDLSEVRVYNLQCLKKLFYWLTYTKINKSFSLLLAYMKIFIVILKNQSKHKLFIPTCLILIFIDLHIFFKFLVFF